MTGPRTLLDKIWDSHVVHARPDGYTLLYIDRHLLHDGSYQAFAILKQRGLTVRRPDRHYATPDHFISTKSRSIADIRDPVSRDCVEQMYVNVPAAGIPFFGIDDDRQGIAHVVGPEQGITQPGLTLVCGDSHTATHGALGALAFGIGTTEVAHVMATQTLWQKKPKRMRITIDGKLGFGVSGKDVILAIIGKIGTAGGVGHVIEYAGSAVRALSIEGRLTMCNMSIEAGARAGMIAPDDTTIAYMAGRPFAPKGADFDRSVAHWRTLPTDEGATFDTEVSLDAAEIAPMVTWGTSPEDALPVTAAVPDPAAAGDSGSKAGMERALGYMGLKPGTPFEGVPVDRVFIGSCTNGRIEDLRAAAAVAKGRRAVVPSWVVPGSRQVKLQAEREGLDRIFRDAGFEWREPGCSMCIGMNGDIAAEGERTASTSNRNFAGRQGKGVRTHLMSPAMAAAAAVTGRMVDVRRLVGNE